MFEMETLMKELCDSPHRTQDYEELKSEVMRWREFGGLLTQSYEELKRENAKLKEERTTDSKIKEAYSDQITKLRLLLRLNEKQDS